MRPVLQTEGTHRRLNPEPSEEERKVSMAGRVALVTGAGSGIGAATARKLADLGADLALNDVSPAALEETIRSMEDAGRRVLPVAADVTDPQAVKEMMECVVGAFGRIDILVNNVGGGGAPHPLEETSVDVWDRTIALNLRSVFLCTREAVPHMKRAGWGRVVNVSSVAGRGRALTAGAEYAAAKAGVIGFTRHVSAELAPFGVLVNAVAPALTATARVRAKFEGMSGDARARVLAGVPVGRWAQPEEVAAAIAFLCSEEAGYICGAVLDVNGGVFVG